MRLSLKILFASIFLIFGNTLFGDIPYVTGPDNAIALQGADIVSYFTDGQYSKGNSSHKALYKGVVWLFTTNEHLQQFKRNPEQFIPQYQGYSAYDMSKGKLTDSIPTLWCIFDKKLYLNNNAKEHQQWLRNKGSYITGGDLNWKRMLQASKTN